MIIEVRKLEEARMYIDRMCEGMDPITTRKSDDPNNPLNNENFTSTMNFVRNILISLKTGELQSREKNPFPYDILNDFRYTEDVGITNLIKKIYAPVAGCNIQKLSPQAAGLWLRDHGYITTEFNEKLGGEVCMPTPKGEKIGLYYRTRDFQGRKYVQIYYSRPAQEFVVHNFRKLLDYRKNDTSVNVE